MVEYDHFDSLKKFSLEIKEAGGMKGIKADKGYDQPEERCLFKNFPCLSGKISIS